MIEAGTERKEGGNGNENRRSEIGLASVEGIFEED